ncbi:MAG: GTPase HflX, partial [Atopobiaceae bacterium]|nr:GTPase HflX [Atopobiaceae bacterium]
DRTDLALRYPEASFVSALEGRGTASLLHRIAEEAARDNVTITALIPYSKGILTKMVHERCQVVRETYREDGLLVTASVPQRVAAALEPYRVDEE